MALYTQTGDAGETDLPDGRRVRKSDALLEAVGTVDELSSHVGLCLAAAEAGGQVGAALEDVQAELFTVGAVLAAQRAYCGAGVQDQWVRRLERRIDAACAAVGPLEHFVVPGGCELAARLHVARTVCRRAERRVVAAADAGAELGDEPARYLNRLGDLLFALARLANRFAGAREVPWRAEDRPQGRAAPDR